MRGISRSCEDRCAECERGDDGRLGNSGRGEDVGWWLDAGRGVKEGLSVSTGTFLGGEVVRAVGGGGGGGVSEGK